MTKLEFLSALEAALERANVPDAEDIVEEYAQHFAFKLADGYSEEEIAARLGDPAALAAQFEGAGAQRGGGKKALTVLGLCFADFFFGVLCVLLFAWVVVMAALTVCCAAGTVCLLGGWNIAALLPEMPWGCAVIFAVLFAALAVLAAVGCGYFFAFVRQLMRAFGRFHKNALAQAGGGAALPSVTAYPQWTARTKRRVRRLSLIAVSVFAVCLIVGFAACAASAGAIEFWHAWGWFGHGR